MISLYGSCAHRQDGGRFCAVDGDEPVSNQRRYLIDTRCKAYAKLRKVKAKATIFRYFPTDALNSSVECFKTKVSRRVNRLVLLKPALRCQQIIIR